MDEIVIIGGGGHSKVVVSIIRKARGYNILGYTDHRDCGLLLGATYLGTDRDLEFLAAKRPGLSAVVAVGQVGLGKRREEIQNSLRPFGLRFPSMVSPEAIVNDSVSIGEGVVVMDGAVINCGTSIGEGSIVNTNSTIEHDVCIAEWVHVAPGVTISGGVTIGRFSMIGVGATVIEGINIPSGCVVGAGAVVVHELSEPGVYVGCPARRVK